MLNVVPEAGGRSRLVRVALLSLVGLAGLSAAERAVPLPGSTSMVELRAEMQRREDSYTFELVGVSMVADEPVAIFSVNGQLCSVRGGFDLWGRMVDEVDVTNQRMMMHRRDGTKMVFSLATSDPVKIPAMADAQREFLLSKDGFRRTIAAQSEAAGYGGRWPSISRDQQVKIIQRYLEQGIVMGALQGEGYAGQLFERQWVQLRKQKREMFLSSLSSEQRAAYNSTAQSAMRLGGPPPDRAKVAEELKAAESRRKDFIASLTPAQKAIYDEYQSWMRP